MKVLRMVQQEQPNTIQPRITPPIKPLIRVKRPVNFTGNVEQVANVDTLPLPLDESKVEEAKHRLLMPDTPTTPLRMLVQEVAKKMLSTSENHAIVQADNTASQEIEVRHRLLMPDTPTLLLKPVEAEKVSKTKPDLRQRVIRALNKRKPEKFDKRTTTAIPILDMDAQVYGQVEPGTASVPVNPIHDAPASPFSAIYVNERLNRSICEAQVNKQYNEAIRLQLLAWKMEDKEISPIEVARKAWLRPAQEKASEKPAS